MHTTQVGLILVQSCVIGVRDKGWQCSLQLHPLYLFGYRLIARLIRVEINHETNSFNADGIIGTGAEPGSMWRWWR